MDPDDLLPWTEFGKAERCIFPCNNITPTAQCYSHQHQLSVCYENKIELFERNWHQLDPLEKLRKIQLFTERNKK